MPTKAENITRDKSKMALFWDAAPCILVVTDLYTS
jgi:hypothetical protein